MPKKEQNKNLHLVLKYKWFDMIEAGIKKEEYREMKKFWEQRLTTGIGNSFDFKDFDTVTFQRGYSKDCKKIIFECLDITVKYANPKWCEKGAENELFYTIKLGERLL